MDSFATASRDDEALVLISVGLPCFGITAEAFLRSAVGGPRFLWRSPNDARVIAGAGIVHEFSGWGAGRFEQVERAARALFAGRSPLSTAEPLLFGGFAFRDDFVPDLAWAEFPPAHFVLPHFQFEFVSGRDDADALLSLNAQVAPSEATPALIDAMRMALREKRDALLASRSAPVSAPHVDDYHALVDKDAWTRMIDRALSCMENTPLRKVVLARTDALAFDGPAPVDAVMSRLDAAYPETYRFLFEPSPGRAFFGATPELLIGLQGAMLRTMALAGSIRRGRDPAEDRELAGQLLGSTKDRHEHQIVIDDVAQRLSRLSDAQPILGETGVLAFKNIQHLHTPLSIAQTRAASVFDVVAELHPTSALGGQPRDLALPLISELEPVTRGWYAGPIGWVDSKLHGEFGVAIRSAVAQDDRAWLYAGAGIVPGSVPEQEWRETAIKLTPMQRALDPDGAIHRIRDAECAA
jgi:menaquinone-specific isochorismate synthase